LLLSHLRARFAREEGQALVEYALIVSLIAIVAILMVTLAGEKVSTIFSEIASGLT
jgi:pilus assembly protein Flp/PilA